MSDNILTKIRALLAKAERTDNIHEAEAFTAKAVEMMTKHAIDDATIRAGSHEKPIITDKKLNIFGPYTTQKLALLNAIATRSRCQLISLGKNKNVISLQGHTPDEVHIFGRSDDIDFVEMLFSSLLVQQAVELSKTPMPPWEHAKTFRTAFMQGYTVVIANRLNAINEEVMKETGLPTSTALVLVDDKKQADDAMRAEYPKTRTVVRRSNTNSVGFGKGDQAGERADIGNKRLGDQKKLNN